MNLLVLRFANICFEAIWNHHHIASVQVIFKARRPHQPTRQPAAGQRASPSARGARCCACALSGCILPSLLSSPPAPRRRRLASTVAAATLTSTA